VIPIFLCSGYEIFFIKIRWIYPFLGFHNLGPQHSVLEDCKLPYNKFELVLDKIAEITYFLGVKLLFYIFSPFMGAKRLRRG